MFSLAWVDLTTTSTHRLIHKNESVERGRKDPELKLFISDASTPGRAYKLY